MRYRISITAFEPAPDYAEKIKHWRSIQGRYGNGYNSGMGCGPEPPPEVEVKKLETVLSEAEFKVLRDTVLFGFLHGEPGDGLPDPRISQAAEFGITSAL